MHVLVCDDDKGARIVIRSLLERQLNCTVQECVNGAEALVMLEGTAFDIAIIDINMPLLDGVAVVRAVRGSSRLRDLKIVMMTSDCREEVVINLVQLGVCEFIAKPFVRQTTLPKLERVMTLVASSQGDVS